MSDAARTAHYLKFRKAPIIIGGCPRSGTSLLLSVLSALPGVYAIEEEACAFYNFYTLEEFADFMDGRLRPRIPEGAETEFERWAEKSPQNIFAFHHILRYFGPEVRLISIIRDGRDVILSRHPHEPDRYWVPGWKWKYYLKECLKYSDHPQVHTIFYENLINDFSNEIEKICDFIGEPCGDEMRNWHAHAKIVEHSAWHNRLKPLSGGSIGRWRDHREEAVVTDFLADEEAQALLRRLGYH